MWSFSHDQTSVSESAIEDFRYQDLCQENAILKQELSDLYSHLMIIDESNEISENSKVSSVGRLIVYDKTKRDTEILLANESSRQKICVLEKELSFQHSHLKDQSLKMKDLENKLTEAKQLILRLETDVISTVSLRAKVKELTTMVESHNSKDFINAKRMVDLEQNLIESTQKVKSREDELLIKTTLLSDCEGKLLLSEGKLKVSEMECSSLTEQLKVSTDFLMETQIQHKKDEVLLLVSQSEARHLERKCESQTKELLRLKDASEKQLTTTSTTKEGTDRLSMRIEKISTRRSFGDRPCESEDEDITPLMALDEGSSLKTGGRRSTGDVDKRRSQHSHRQSSTSSSSNSSDRERERLRSEDMEAARRHRHQQQQRHNEVTYNGHISGGGGESRGGGGRDDRANSRHYRPVQQRADDKEEEDRQLQGEDCMCGFFPQPFKM